MVGAGAVSRRLGLLLVCRAHASRHTRRAIEARVQTVEGTYAGPGPKLGSCPSKPGPVALQPSRRCSSHRLDERMQRSSG